MKRRPSREINIFNLSMLDVICSALGAFLILFVVAAQNTAAESAGRDECLEALKDCLEEPCATRCPCDEHCPCAGRCPCPATDCAQQCPCDTTCPCETNCPCDQYCSCPNPPPPFAAVLIRWTTPNIDVDLHVTDPRGRTCNFSERTACGGELVYDYRNSGYTEVFLARRVPTDDRWWTISYHYFSGGGPVEVLGAVYHAEGVREIPPRRMTPADRRGLIPVLKFKAGADGRLHFASP